MDRRELGEQELGKQGLAWMEDEVGEADAFLEELFGEPPSGQIGASADRSATLGETPSVAPVRLPVGFRLGVWVDVGGRALAAHGAQHAAHLTALGVTDACIMVNRLQDRTFRFGAVSEATVTAFAAHLAGSATRLTLTSWLRPEKTYIDGLLAALPALAQTVGARGIEFDVEEPWSRTQPKGFASHDAAAAYLLNGLQPVRNSGLELSVTCQVDPMTSRRMTALVRGADVVVPQAYSTYRADRNHAIGGVYGPRGIQDRAVNRLATAFGSPGRPMIMGLAAYGRSRWPGTSPTALMKMELAHVAGLTNSGVTGARYWSWKHIMGRDGRGGSPANSYATGFLRAVVKPVAPASSPTPATGGTSPTEDLGTQQLQDEQAPGLFRQAGSPASATWDESDAPHADAAILFDGANTGKETAPTAISANAVNLPAGFRLGVWVDVGGRALAAHGSQHAARLNQLGVTDACIMINRLDDAAFRFGSVSRSTIRTFASRLNGTITRLTLTSWLRPDKSYIDALLATLPPFAQSVGAQSIEFDVEEPWSRARPRGFATHDAAAAYLFDGLQTVRSAGIAVSITCQVDPVTSSRLRELVRRADLVVPQAYSVYRAGRSSHAVGGVYGPRGLQDRALSRVATALAASGRPMLMGLAAYNRTRWPGHTGAALMQMELSHTASLSSAGVEGVRYWSWKYIAGLDARGGRRANRYAAGFLGGVTGHVPLVSTPATSPATGEAQLQALQTEQAAPVGLSRAEIHSRAGTTQLHEVSSPKTTAPGGTPDEMHVSSEAREAAGGHRVEGTEAPLRTHGAPSSPRDEVADGFRGSESAEDEDRGSLKAEELFEREVHPDLGDLETLSETPPPTPPTPPTAAPAPPSATPYGQSFTYRAASFNCSPQPPAVVPASYLPRGTSNPDTAIATALTAAGLSASQQARVRKPGLRAIAGALGAETLIELLARLRWSPAALVTFDRSQNMLVPRLLIHLPGHFRELARRTTSAREAHALESCGWLVMTAVRDAVASATRDNWWVPPAPAFVTALPSPLPTFSAALTTFIGQWPMLSQQSVTAATYERHFALWKDGLAGRQWHAEVRGSSPGLPLYASLLTIPAHVDTAAPRAQVAAAWAKRLTSTDATNTPLPATATTVTRAGLQNAVNLRQCNSSSMPAGVTARLPLQGLELAYEFPARVGDRRISRLTLLSQLQPVFEALFRTLRELGWNDLIYQTSGAGCFRGIKQPASQRVSVDGRRVLVNPFTGPQVTAQTVQQINTLFTEAQRRRVVAKCQTARTMSEHGLATAVDLNYQENLQAVRSRPLGSMDPRAVALFEAFHFRWGGCFSTTDPHHFEYCQQACAPTPSG